MKHVLVGAAVFLSLITGYFGWRWISFTHLLLSAGHSTPGPPPGPFTTTPGPQPDPFTTPSTSSRTYTPGTLRPVSTSTSSQYPGHLKNITTTVSRKLTEQTENPTISDSITSTYAPTSSDREATSYSHQNYSTHTALSVLQTTVLPSMGAIGGGSGTENNRNISQPVNSTEDDIDYVKMGQEILVEASTILDTGIWDFERRTEDGDAIFSRQLDNGNMVYRLTGIVDMPAQDLLVIIYDGVADYPKWNPSLLECRVLEKINDQTDISYTVSAPGARGYVASRDFVTLRHWNFVHNTYVAASKSIDFPGAPCNNDYIRGQNGPGCMELRPLSSDPSKTEFRWLLNTKLNGWILSYIADKAYKKFMTKYMILLREYCKKIKQRASDFTLPSNVTN